MCAAFIQRLFGTRRSRRFTFCQQGEIQQAMGVVIGRAKHLAAGQILVDGGDATFQPHIFAGQRQAVGQAWQGGAIGAQQEDGFHQIA